MGLDWIAVLLGIIVVLIFMAIFTLLRTMNSPFIKRFESILGQPMKKAESPAHAYSIQFLCNGRQYRLLEVNYEHQKSLRETIKKNYLFLEVQIKSNLMIRFRHIMQNQNADKMFQMLLDFDHEARGSEIFAGDLSDFFKDIKVNTSDPLKARIFLSRPEVLKILADCRSKAGAYGLFEVIPLTVESGRTMIDYRLSEKLTNQLIYDPRFIKKHIQLLDELAKQLESL